MSELITSRESIIEYLGYLDDQEKYWRLVENIRSSFPEFIKASFRCVSPKAVYSHNWHIDCMAEYLAAAQRQEVKRLILNIPPRMMKSITVTVAWPAWLLGEDPRNRIIAGSYSKGLAVKHSIDSRRIMGRQWYLDAFPDTRIAEGQNEKSKFVTTALGHRMAVSVGSTVTGEGGNFLITDDPMNPIQAQSEADRETANSWFTGTLTSRLDDPVNDVMVIVMQRLHEDDLSGHVQTLDPDEWTVVSLEAMFEKKKTISYGKFKKTVKENELLHPDRLPKVVLDKKRRTMGEYQYSGQYQQNPSPTEGGILKKKWWMEWLKPDLPTFDLIVQSYDTAIEEKEESDYSVRTTWGVFKMDEYFPNGRQKVGAILLECMEEKISYNELKKNALASYRDFKPDVILVENRASGHMLVQDLKRAGLPVRKIQVTKDKVVHAHMAAPILEAGCVWYVNKKWVKRVITQCAQFPKATNDDIVTSATLFWLWIRRRFWLGLPDDDEINYAEEEAHRHEKNSKKRYY